jgi:hypothetical protein
MKDEIYSGLAGYGKFKSLIGLVVALIIFLILIAIGIAIVVSNSKYNQINANVSSATCRDLSGNFECDLNLEYIVGNQSYNRKLVVKGLDTQIFVGQIFQIEYLIDDPLSIRQSNTSLIWLGWILIILGIIILIVSIVTTIFTFKYKPYAAFSGANSLISSIGR